MIVIHVEGGIVRGVYCPSKIGEPCIVVDEDDERDPEFAASLHPIEGFLDIPEDVRAAAKARYDEEERRLSKELED
jgi:hypothetical protein